jgi:hypothetical protein
MIGFQYQAYATGLNGYITRPFNEIIPVQASAALPDNGGFGSSRVENFRFHDIISFSSATAVVSGSEGEKDNTYGALAVVTIENLNILSMVTADLVVARISSHYPKDPGQEPFITPVGSYFVNLRIAGYPVAGDLDTSVFCASHRHSDILQKLFPHADPGKRGRMRRSLYPTLGLTGPVKEEGPGIFHVKGFGTIQLAQFVMTPEAARITMFNVEFGSTPEGNVCGGGAEGNGSAGG